MNVSMNPGDDPLGLRELPEPRPDPRRIEQDWTAVSAALDARSRLRRRAWTGGLAAAASIALVAALVWLPGYETATPETLGPATAHTASDDSAPGNDAGQVQTGPAQASDAEALMAMSQDAERQLRRLRKQVGTMPSQTVVYQVELQDLIGQIDDALGMSPDSAELWGQRLSLQLDLMRLYSNQLRRDDAHLASL